MKASSVRALRELYRFTNRICKTSCSPATSCCAAMFCDAAARGLAAAGLPVPAHGPHPKLRFMGPDGCVLAPELRPGCTGFVCPEKLADRTVRREHERLERRAFESDEVRTMLHAACAPFAPLAGDDS